MTLESVLDLFFPPRCAVCGEVTQGRVYLCDNCRKNLPLIEGKICQRCGAEEERCVCSAEHNSYDSVCAPFYYDGEITSAVYRIKRSNDIYSAKILAGFMAQAIKKRHPRTSFDCIIPVPLNVIKMRLKGYNHSQTLAKEVSRLTGIPMQTKGLVRHRYTPQQKKLSALDRLMNISGAFSVRKKTDFKGKRILLIDDVKTTGATLSECAKTLKASGAAKVDCLALALTCRKG